MSSMPWYASTFWQFVILLFEAGMFLVLFWAALAWWSRSRRGFLILFALSAALHCLHVIGRAVYMSQVRKASVGGPLVAGYLDAMLILSLASWILAILGGVGALLASRQKDPS